MSTSFAQRRSISATVRRLVAPALVLLLGSAIVAWAWNRTPQPPPQPTPVTSVPLRNVSLACPATATAGAPPSRIELSAVSLADPAEQTGGRVSARPLPDGPTFNRLSITSAPGQDQLIVPPTGAAQVQISGQGPLAPGLSAFAATTAAREAGGGLTVVGCPSATRSWWFVGAGATIDHASTVVVTNPDPTEAIASIDVLGLDGPLETVGTEGLVIAPGESVAVALSEVAAGQEELAINVEASQGRVAAAVLDSWSTALRPNGTEWLPAAASPTGELNLAGIPAGGEPTLVVANPGERSTRVLMSVSDADGTFQTEDVRMISVAARSVEAIDLPGTLGRRALTVRLSSPTPITAALRDRFGSADDDVAYAGTAPALDGPSAAPAANGTDDALPHLILSGADPQRDAEAVVEAYRRDGQLLGSVGVEVPAGTSQLQTVTLPRSAEERAAYVVVRPEQGTVQASAVYSGARGISVLTLTTPMTTALAPQVIGRE